MKLSQKGLILVLVPVAFEFLFVGVLFYMLQQSELELTRAENARQIVTHLNRVQRHLLIFISGLTPYAGLESAKGRARTEQSMNAINGEIDALKLCLKDKPEQLATIENMQQMWKEAQDISITLKSSMAANTLYDTASSISKGRRMMAVLLKQSDEVRQQTEAIEADSPIRQAENRENMKKLLLAGLAVNVLLALSLAISFNKVLARRLAIVVDNTRRLASAKPLNQPLSGNDEIAELDKVFGKMAAAISASQQKERALLDNAVDIICSLDHACTISDISPACMKLWGYAPEDLLSRRILSLVAEEDTDQTKAQFDAIKTSGNTENIENRIRRKDGSMIDMLWSVSWVASEKAFFCVAHDDTDRKNAERMKADFVSMLSHDLRSPLNSIQAFVCMIKEKVYGTLDERGMRQAIALDETITWLIEMISNLLDIDKIEAGLSELELDKQSLKGLLEQANNALSNSAEAKKIAIILPANDAMALVDSGLFMRVLTNLLSNAIKFSSPGSEVRIMLERKPEMVTINFIDQGPGIAAADQATIFERYKQIKGQSEQRRGSGLGLAVCKTIVEQHKGTIGVTSTPGQGSTFWVRLPAADA